MFENGRVVGVDMEGFGPCRPDDGCSGGGEGTGGGTKPGTLTIAHIECDPNPVSLAAGAWVECGVDEQGVDPEDVVSIVYSFGDGTPPGEYWARGYTATGTYTVTITVVAKDGQRASASINVTVTA